MTSYFLHTTFHADTIDERRPLRYGYKNVGSNGDYVQNKTDYHYALTGTYVVDVHVTVWWGNSHEIVIPQLFSN